MSTAEKYRDCRNFSSEKLRTARRRYALKVWRLCLENPDITPHLAFRMQQRGFYAQTTGKRDTMFSLWRHIYKFYCKEKMNSSIYPCDWWSFMDQVGMDDSWKRFKMGVKPRIKIRKAGQ